MSRSKTPACRERRRCSRSPARSASRSPASRPDARARRCPSGVTEVSGSLSVGSELENDGMLRAVLRRHRSQFNAVATPADSAGAFDAQGTGVLSFSNVVMGAASSATGTGTIRFAGGTSRVAPGAGYAAGITELGNGGDLDFDDDGSTGALRMHRGWHSPWRRHVDRRRRPILARLEPISPTPARPLSAPASQTTITDTSARLLRPPATRCG